MNQPFEASFWDYVWLEIVAPACLDNNPKLFLRDEQKLKRQRRSLFNHCCHWQQWSIFEQD
jgi:hypothetical protein